MRKIRIFLIFLSNQFPFCLLICVKLYFLFCVFLVICCDGYMLLLQCLLGGAVRQMDSCVPTCSERKNNGGQFVWFRSQICSGIFKYAETSPCACHQSISDWYWSRWHGGAKICKKVEEPEGLCLHSIFIHAMKVAVVLGFCGVLWGIFFFLIWKILSDYSKDFGSSCKC